jgi:hypothetical protein
MTGIALIRCLYEKDPSVPSGDDLSLGMYVFQYQISVG